VNLLRLILKSSVGKKALVAAAGLLLCGFLIVHLGGNLILFSGENAFNGYAASLDKNPLIPLAEIILAVLFIGHIILALWTKAENAGARPEDYRFKRWKRDRWYGSKTAFYSGLLILVFLIIHLRDFRFGTAPQGLYRLVMESFKSAPYAGFYAAAMGALGLHLGHGFQAAFQSLGLRRPRVRPAVDAMGTAFAWLVAGGFAIIPVWAYFK
jgi:succinate dehydrogenase / fumarate reductase cytochrome b subunit